MKQLTLLAGLLIFLSCTTEPETYTLRDATNGLEILNSVQEGNQYRYKIDRGRESETWLRCESPDGKILSSVAIELWTGNFADSRNYDFVSDYFQNHFDKSISSSDYNKCINEKLRFTNGFYMGRNSEGNLEVRLEF